VEVRGLVHIDAAAFSQFGKIACVDGNLLHIG
jgi:hypothetical protein